MLFHIHEHPWDYWRFTPEGFGLLLAPFSTREVISHGHPLLPESVMGVGVKGEHPPLDLASLPRTRGWIEGWGAGRPVEIGAWRMTLRELWGETTRQTMRVSRSRARRILDRVTRHYRASRR
jgi:hypothetical protein